MIYLCLKKKAHELGLKIYAGENRLRKHGDSLTCCGIDGLDGFNGNHFNLNHLVNGDNVKPTEKMLEKGTGKVFGDLFMSNDKRSKWDNQSFAFNMVDYYKHKKKLIDSIFATDKNK